MFRSNVVDDRAVQLTAGPGIAAVGCFFVLSGFILVWVARPTDTARTFWRRRIAKVYPNHAVTWVAGLALMVIVGREFNVLAMLPSLLLVQVWLPHAAVFEGTNGPAWTLACEVFFYALFPVLAVRVGRVEPDRLIRLGLWLLAGVVAYTALVAAVVPTEPRAETGLPVPAAQLYALVFLPPVRLVEFVLGMVVARIVIEGRWPSISRSWLLGAVAAGYALSLLLPAPLGYLVPFLPAIVLIIGSAAVADAAGRRGRFRSAPALIWLGEVSFAFYLIHWLVLRNMRRLVSDDAWTTPLVLVYFAAALVLSLVLARMLYLAVEVPMVRRWASPRPAPQTSTVVGASAPVRPVTDLEPVAAPAGAFGRYSTAAGRPWPPTRAGSETVDSAPIDAPVGAEPPKR